MLRTCRYTCCRAGHIWPICTAGFITYRKVYSHVLSRPSTSNHAAFFGMVANHRAHDPSAGHWTVPAGGGAVTATQGGIGLAATSCMITLSLNFSQDGPYTARYSCTCCFFRLRQNCRYRRFFHLRASKPAFLTLERNYPASGIIKYKFYCLLSLRCCNWLTNYFCVSTTSMRNCIKTKFGQLITANTARCIVREMAQIKFHFHAS